MKEGLRLELRKLLLFAAAVAALVLVALAYRPADQAPFLWDDHVLVDDTAPYRQAPLLSLFTRSFWPSSPLSDARAEHYYRPIVLLSLRADAALDDTAQQFHRTNVGLHLLACVLVAIVAARSGAGTGAAIVAATVWGLAPRLTEAVAWISGRTDVLAAVFGLAALALCPRDEGRLRRARLAATALLLFFALCSKEVALAHAAATFVSLRRWRDRAVIVGAPLVVWVALRVHALESSEQPLRELGAVRRAGTALEAAFRYVEMTFDALRPRTSIGMVGALDSARVAGGAALAVGLALVVPRLLRHRSREMRASVILVVVSIGLVLHVVPLSLSGAVTADRLLYTPLAGVAIAIAIASRNARPLGALGLALATVFVPTTRERAADYRDEARFWLVAAEGAHPENPMPLLALAARVEAAGARPLACSLLARARELTGSASQAALRRADESYAACLVRTGRYEAALTLLEALSHRHPEHARIRMELGFARLHVLDFDGAARELDRAVAMDGRLAPVVAHARRGLDGIRVASARFSTEEARRAHPYEYGALLIDLGHLGEADDVMTTLALDPSAHPTERERAASFVVQNGRIEHAAAVVAQDPRWSARFKQRRRLHDALLPLLGRIERLLPDR